MLFRWQFVGETSGRLIVTIRLWWLSWGWETLIMLHNAVSDPLRPSSRSRLSWRSPSVKNDPDCEVRRYPATTVLLPAQLHSDSCNSIFSSWDIEREEGRAASERREERRAPLAHFRRSYILSDCKEPDYHPPQPPVTLSLRQGFSSEILSFVLIFNIYFIFILNYFWPVPQSLPTPLSKQQLSVCFKLAGLQSNFTKQFMLIFLQWTFKNKNKGDQRNIV